MGDLSMIVEEIMNTDVSTLTKEHTIADAIQLLSDRRIRHIPIVDGDNQLLGIVSDRDIKDATPSMLDIEGRKEVLNQSISSIMSTNIITGHPLDFVEEVSAIFYDTKISCLPIVKDHKLVGIITQTDLLHTLVELTGAHQPGSQLEVRVPNKPGKLFHVFSCIQNRKVNILSVLVYPDKKDEFYKIIVLRIQTMNPLSLIEDLEESGFEVLWPNLPGMEAE